MTFTLAIPTLSRFDLLETAIRSALAGSLRPDRVIVLDQRGAMPDGTTERLAGACTAAGIKWGRVVPARQISLGAAWNYFLRYAPVVIGSDDVRLHDDTLRRLVNAAERGPGLYASGQDPVNRFALFLLTEDLWRAVGPFDEAFYPAYFEDNDYEHRLKLAGYRISLAPGCTYQHAGSATLDAKSQPERWQHWADFDRNAARYAAKWGGPPGAERYAAPFDGRERAAA